MLVWQAGLSIILRAKKKTVIYRFRAEVFDILKNELSTSFLDMKIHWHRSSMDIKVVNGQDFQLWLELKFFKKRVKLERKIKVWINNWQDRLPAQFQRISNNFTFVWHVTNFLRNATQAKSWRHFKCKYRVMYSTENQCTLLANQVRYLRAITRFSVTSRAHEPSSLQHYYVINIVS